MSPLRAVDHRYLLPEVIDPPQKCLTIPIPDDPAHERAFFAAIGELTKPWVWALGEADEQPDTAKVWQDIVRFASDAYYFQNGNCMFQLRTNPTNGCQLQQSLDGGTTWITVFDYGLCVDASIENTINYDTTIYIDDSNTTYNNNIVNIYPEWDYSTGDNNDQNTAMCFASKAFVDMACDATLTQLEETGDDIISFIQGQVTVKNSVGAILGALAAVGVFPYAFTVGALALVGSSIISEILINLVDEEDIPALADQDARDVIACAMYLAMAHSTPDYTAWSESIELGDYTGNELVVAYVVKEWSENESSFVQWMGLMAGAIYAAEQELIENECLDCVGDEWCYVFDFSVDDGGWGTGIPDRDFGTYEGGAEGWQSEFGQASGIWDERLYINIDFTATNFTYMKFEFSADGNAGTGRLGLFRLYDGVTLKKDVQVSSFDTDGSEVITFSSFAALQGDQLQVIINESQPTEFEIVTNLHRLVLKGEGTNPFGLDNCTP